MAGQIETLAEKLIPVIKNHTKDAIEPMERRIAALEEQIETLLEMLVESCDD